MKVSRVLAAFSAALVLVAATAAQAAPKGPPYYDPKRGIERQQNAARDAVKECRGGDAQKVFEHLTSVSAYVRDAVFKLAVKDFDEAKVLKLVPGLGSKDPFVAGQVAEILGTRKVRDARGALEKALSRQRSEEVLAEICWALGEIGDAGSSKVLEKTAKKFSRTSFRVGGEAYQALSRCDKAAAAQHLLEGLKAKRAGVRIACLATLIEVDASVGLDAAFEQLGERQEKGWETRVLFQALECFRSVDPRQPHAAFLRRAMDSMVERLATEDGRARHEVGKTLRSLTGQWDLGDDPEAWQGWWKQKRDGYKFPARDKKREGEADAGATGGTVARYFGIPIYSKRVAFLFDLSGGMDRPIGGKGTDTEQRIIVAKRELGKTLETLEADVRTNVIFFASQFYAFAKTLLPVKKALGRMLAYIKEQQIPDKPHSNRGNLYDPLVLACLQPEVDTIYLVTEGNPTEGRFIDRDRFVRHLLRITKFTKTEVNALFIGNAKSAQRYLNAVAEPTGGRFFDVAKGDTGR